MKKALVITLLAAALTIPPAAPSYTVEAFGGSSILGSIFKKAISHSRKSSSGSSAGRQTTTSGSKKQKYKNAMGALENLQWVGVVRSSGGEIYFDQDTMNDRLVNGERRVTATMKNEFTKAGAKAVAKDSDEELDDDDVACSLYLVDFGEKDCFVASHVTYYDKKGKKLIERKAGEAYVDVTSMDYGKPYTEGSVVKTMKERVFTYADRVKSEEEQHAKEQAEADGVKQ